MNVRANAIVAGGLGAALLSAVVACRGAGPARPEGAFAGEEAFEGEVKEALERLPVSPAVVATSSERPVTVGVPPPGGATTQVRLGFDVGDQWEPAIAVDRLGHVYVLYSQYQGVPGCPACANPTQILQRSADHGETWASPAPIDPAGAAAGGQWDSQLAVDPVDGRTVYASWLQNNKSEIAVARSDDFGATWSTATASATHAGTDKPIVAVRGADVYVAYNHAQTMWVAASHDGGRTFREVKVNHNGKLGWSLSGGGTVTPAGTVLFAWAGYEGSGGARGAVNLYVSRSTDGGATWTTRLLETSASPPDCAAYSCGWAYLGAQATLASDAAGAVYVAWNAGAVARGPERVYLARSLDDGVTYSPRAELSTAPAGTAHAFPAIAAGVAGDVRVAWMDARAAGGGLDRWNVYTRRTVDRGVTWSPELDVSGPVAGLPYLFADGFRFPFGDYWELATDETGGAHLVFGEGHDYATPGSIWYVHLAP